MTSWYKAFFFWLQPGRVATLIEDHEAVTYGVAFQLINEAALDYLNNREVALGGYISHITMFIPRDPSRMPMPVLLYVATPSNQHWLGHAPSENIANQVQFCGIDVWETLVRHFWRQQVFNFMKHPLSHFTRIVRVAFLRSHAGLQTTIKRVSMNALHLSLRFKHNCAPLAKALQNTTTVYYQLRSTCDCALSYVRT